MLVETVFATGRRQQWWKMLLVISLALNLFFVAGAVWVRLHPPGSDSFEQRLDTMAGELGLNVPQKAAFERYAQTMRERLQAMRRTIRPQISAAWSEMASAHADESKVMRLFDEAAQLRRGSVRDMTTTTLSFLSGLSPEQRAKFIQLVMHQHQRPWAPPPEQAAPR